MQAKGGAAGMERIHEMLRNKTAVVEDIDREILRAVEDQTRRNEDRYRAERQELENIQANLNNRE